MPDTILLVEDELIISLVESRRITDLGYRVVTAKNGETAVDVALTNGNISLILMDINLGKGINGLEAAKKILETKALPVIFLTSHNESEYTESISKIPNYGFVLKNAPDSVLRSTIEAGLKTDGPSRTKAHYEDGQHVNDD